MLQDNILSFLLLVWEISNNLAKCSESSGLFHDTGLLNADLWKSECTNPYLLMRPIKPHPSPWQSICSLCRFFLGGALKHATLHKVTFSQIASVNSEYMWVILQGMYKHYTVEMKHYIWILEVLFPLKKFIWTENKFRDITKKNAKV